MSQEPEPMVLELAPLARDQIGPFLLLGLDKEATPDQMEGHWAQRVLWARKGRIRTPLEDVNWAREALRDADQRAVFEAASLNVVLTDGYLHNLAERFGLEGRPGTLTRPRWQPCQQSAPGTAATTESPANTRELPQPGELQAGILLPEPGEEFPAVSRLLEEATKEAIDPWSI